ncbi:MAG: TlyA family RNA methyltransferase [Clostridiales bacterium]|nr:TlyA family RNA methyltransferase [Candidatus Coliplasma equi]
MRLDVFLAERGGFPSRSKASIAIGSGFITVDGKVIKKNSFEVAGDEDIVFIGEKERFVSRAGEKLFHALKEFKFDVHGLTALDIGASTGGFTDCLLQNGAKKVFALDVGKDQLDARLREDGRVVVMENFNARELSKDDLGEEIDVITMDVSFISQTLIYKACAEILDSGKTMITLIKPQFEAGRANIGKGGIVRDKDGKIIKEILEKIDFEAAKNGFTRVGFTPSPIEGGDGNKEYLAIFVKG